jgi:hypothetical protein
MVAAVRDPGVRGSGEPAPSPEAAATLAFAPDPGSTPRPGILAVSGPLAFARFAAPPNVLGYCGGDDHATLVEHLRLGLDGEELLRLCRAFEGAWPYLELIAGAAGIVDPLDPRVVEAYWLGNGLLDRVPPRAFGEHLRARFRGRTARNEWPWLADKPGSGAVPHHSFHVLEVMPRIGMLREGMLAALLPAMEQCLIRPATVLASSPGELTVAVPPLLHIDGGLRFGPAVEARVTAVGPAPRPDTAVAVHWHWSCGGLTMAQERRLRRMTDRALRLASETT